MKIRANHSSYIKKALQEAIMKITQLKQNISKLKLKKTMFHLKNKEMFAVKFTKKRRKYYENLNMKNVTDTRNFGKLLYHFSEINY